MNTLFLGSDKFFYLVSRTQDQYIKTVVFLYMYTEHTKQEFRKKTIVRIL